MARIDRARSNPLDATTPASIPANEPLLDALPEKTNVPDVPRATIAVIIAGNDPTWCLCVCGDVMNEARTTSHTTDV